MKSYFALNRRTTLWECLFILGAWSAMGAESGKWSSELSGREVIFAPTGAFEVRRQDQPVLTGELGYYGHGWSYCGQRESAGVALEISPNGEHSYKGAFGGINTPAEFSQEVMIEKSRMHFRYELRLKKSLVLEQPPLVLLKLFLGTNQTGAIQIGDQTISLPAHGEYGWGSTVAFTPGELVVELAKPVSASIWDNSKCMTKAFRYVCH